MLPLRLDFLTGFGETGYLWVQRFIYYPWEKGIELLTGYIRKKIVKACPVPKYRKATGNLGLDYVVKVRTELSKK
ncbi:hypothetical protein PLACP1_15350 [Planifilum fimeticola]|jgi:hypothetical protein